MTELLDKAFSEASKLSTKQQDDLGARILAELTTRRQARARYADRGVLGGTAGYPSAAPSLTTDKQEIKGLFKQALIELFQEQGDVVRELLAKIVEDAAKVRAIDDGAATAPVSQAEVLRALEATR